MFRLGTLSEYPFLMEEFFDATCCSTIGSQCVIDLLPKTTVKFFWSYRLVFSVFWGLVLLKLIKIKSFTGLILL